MQQKTAPEVKLKFGRGIICKKTLRELARSEGHTPLLRQARKALEEQTAAQ